MVYEHILFFTEETNLTQAIKNMRLMPKEVAFLDREFTEIDGVPVLLLQTQSELDDVTCTQIEQVMQPDRVSFNIDPMAALAKNQQARQAVKAVLQAFLKHKLPSRSEVRHAVKEQYGIDLTWDEVTDLWFDLRDELEQREDLPREQFSDALASATFLNSLKHQVRDVTRSLDATPHRFNQSLEATAVKHAVSTLLSELNVHGLLPETDVVLPADYLRAARRTLYSDLTFEDRLALCGLGLSGEIGEVTDMLKKFLYHRNGKPLDISAMKDELGDVMWYLIILLDTLGITLPEVLAANVAKCERRHSHGFNPRYTSDSHSSE
jgi:NTP pyrophosphatase (non-canonical NTP hydrolase)